MQRLRVETILGRCCSHNTVNLTKLVEVTNIRATTEGAQRVKHIGRRHTGTVALCSINFYLILRESLRVCRHGRGYFRALRQFGQEVLSILGKLRQIAVGRILNYQRNAVTVTIARNLWHLERSYLHVLYVLTVKVEPVHHQRQQVIHTWSLLPVLQSYNHSGEVRTGTRQHTVSAAQCKALHLGNLLHLVLHLLHNLACLLKCGSFRCTQVNQEHTLVLLWYQT